MTKKADILNPTLANILNEYGYNVKSAAAKVGEEAQDGVGSELAVDQNGKTIDPESMFGEYADMISAEGGTHIGEGDVSTPSTPSGETGTFDTYMYQETGGGTEETKKTVEDAGYSEGAGVDSELSVSGSTVEKGAAFIKKVANFAKTQQAFVEQIKSMAKLAEAMPEVAPEMDPAAAMAGMSGEGAVAEDPMADGGEISPEVQALVDAIISSETDEAPLAPEEVAQIEQILAAGDAEGGMPVEDSAAAMGVGGELPPELMGGEPPLAPEEIKAAQWIANHKLAEDDEDGDSDDSPKEDKPAEGESTESHSEPDGDEGGFEGFSATVDEAPEMGGGELGGLGGEMPAGPEVVQALVQENQQLQQIIEAIVNDGMGGEVDMGAGGEPGFAPEELEGMTALAAAETDETKTAAYYGMSVDEYRAALEQQEKQAKLQPKNAAQQKKASRYGQTIDSLIRK